MAVNAFKVKRKKKLAIPKSLNLLTCWNLIGPVVAQEIAGPDYVPIPNLLNTNSYEIGNIFIRKAGQTSCFGSTSIFKVLGPIKNYLSKNETNKRWQSKDFPVVKTFGDHPNFEITLVNNGKGLIFKGEKYYFLSKHDDLIMEKNVVIDRSSHEDLSNVEWIGLIRDVVVTESFELQVKYNTIGRVLHISDRPHTVLFRYEMCKIDLEGRTKSKPFNLKNITWERLESENEDGLPLSKF